MKTSRNAVNIVYEKEETKSSMSSFIEFREQASRYFKTFIELFGIYMFWIVLHYICSNLYASWCTKYTIIGFIISPFVASAPHCTAFRWVITNGGNVITTMWITFGTWCAKKILL
uniref:Uncharacterized protein n=1 Tax=viral metagenome TaxID=1070528 RepID=A0A6C0JMS0_9ZZZZ